MEVHAHACRLENIDIKVSDEDMIIVLTAGLPDSYTPIIITFDALDPEKLTLNFIINCLLNEEAQQVGPQIKEDPESAAMHAGQHGKGGVTILCFYCLVQGHFASVCPIKAMDIKKQEDEGHQQVKESLVASTAWTFPEGLYNSDAASKSSGSSKDFAM